MTNNDFKTLEAVVSRNDYKSANIKLIALAKEIAELFATKYTELFGVYDDTDDFYGWPENAIFVNGHRYISVWNRMRENGVLKHSGFRLARLKCAIDGPEPVYYSLNMTDYGVTASHKDYVEFLNDAQEILSWLDKAETELVGETEAAIETAQTILNKGGRQ